MMKKEEKKKRIVLIADVIMPLLLEPLRNRKCKLYIKYAKEWEEIRKRLES